MPPTRLGPRELLEYDARFGVLICRDCRYAIQKNALQSHLLRHKIYRDERQQLLSVIAQLDLVEPHLVQLPNPASPRVEALPIISGYRCTVAGCENLCASSKRMKRHQSEVHGFHEHPASFYFVREAKLQTFFRGTKMRYFEVEAPVTMNRTNDDLSKTLHGRSSVDFLDGHEQGQNAMHNTGRAATIPPSSPQSSVPESLEAPSKSSNINVDLEMLRYFHHFTTETYITLPYIEQSTSATSYWRTQVVSLAMQRRWLMCGILAISAWHLSIMASDLTGKSTHCKNAMRYLSTFNAGCDQATRRDLEDSNDALESEATKAGERIRFILHSVFQISSQFLYDQGLVDEPPAACDLQSTVATIRGCTISDAMLGTDDTESESSHPPEEAFGYETRVLKMKADSDDGRTSPSQTNIPSALLRRLLDLPSRFADVLGKPKDMKDALAILSSIASLVECCEISFASDQGADAWRGMLLWFTNTSGQFTHMVAHDNPAGLVILAHWAASLVQRVEHCECWFLRGTAKVLVTDIAGRLRTEHHALHALVSDLVS